MLALAQMGGGNGEGATLPENSGTAANAQGGVVNSGPTVAQGTGGTGAGTGAGANSGAGPGGTPAAGGGGGDTNPPMASSGRNNSGITGMGAKGEKEMPRGTGH
jgi:fibronectin-binding autotransporter adhesin